MSKQILLTVGLFVLIAINGINADIDNNEVQDEISMYQGVAVYQNEHECTMVGGLCVHRGDCIARTSKQGLCPMNQHRGVECCYEITLRPAPCKQHLGMCMDRCHKTLMRPGTDCENGQVCCVLI